MTDLPPNEIQDLLNRIARGDHETASAKLYRYYNPQLARYLWSKLRDEHTARDIAHEVLEIAIDRPMKFDGTCAYSTWLIGIAKNLVKAHSRSQRRDAAHYVEDGEACLATLAADEPDPLVAISQAQMSQQVSGCMDGLGVTHRDVLVLHYIAEKSIEDVAALLSIPTGTVKSRMNKARTLLSSCLARKNITGMDS